MLNFNPGYDPYSYDEDVKKQQPTLLGMIATARRVMTLRAIYGVLINIIKLVVYSIPGVVWYAFTRFILGVDPIWNAHPYRLVAKYGGYISPKYHWIFITLYAMLGLLEMCIMGLTVLAQQYIIWFVFKRQKPPSKRDPRDPRPSRRSGPQRPKGPMRF